MRIFLDANILFAAAFTDGAIRRLIRMLLAEGHTLVADAYVLDEARRNLAVKSKDGTRELDRMVGKLEIVPVGLSNSGKLAAALPEKNRPVLASAVQASCDALVTGDRRHFGRLYGQRIASVTIYDPASLAEELLW